MTKVEISLNSVEKIKEFNVEASKQLFDIDIVSSRYVIDAKSIMGLFSLDLSKHVSLHIHEDADKCEEFVAFVKELSAH